MGNSCCGKKKHFKKITLLLVGLDNAGKTVAAKNLAGEPVDAVVPTVGFSVLNLTYQKFKVVLFDLGGGSDIRGIWDEYFVYAHGIIFVVDSSDYNRLDEAKSVLQDLLSHRKISGKPVLLLANKQDDENALDEIDLVDKLQLERIVNNHQCPTLVETCCAQESLKKSTVDSGIKKGYRWLMNYVINNFDKLNKRVESDVEEHEELERKARLETIERIRILNEKEQKCRRDDDIIELYSDYEKQNGGVNIEGDLLQMQRKENEESSVSSKDSLPHIYHVKSEIKQERPKSAVQMVKEQLEMGQMKKNLSFKKLTSNKTAPMTSNQVTGTLSNNKILQVQEKSSEKLPMTFAKLQVTSSTVKLPHSASEKRTVYANGRRTLRSAGDSIFIVSDLPNSAPVTSHGDEFHRDLFQLNNFDKKMTKLPPLKSMQEYSKPYLNGTVIFRRPSGEENGISIIEVD